MLKILTKELKRNNYIYKILLCSQFLIRKPLLKSLHNFIPLCFSFWVRFNSNITIIRSMSVEQVWWVATVTLTVESVLRNGEHVYAAAVILNIHLRHYNYNIIMFTDFLKRITGKLLRLQGTSGPFCHQCRYGRRKNRFWGNFLRIRIAF